MDVDVSSSSLYYSQAHQREHMGVETNRCTSLGSRACIDDAAPICCLAAR
jgi:hypothetical protein